MDEPRYDLIVRAGRVFCADSGLDGPGAVAVSGGRIAAAGPGVEGTAARVLDFPDGVLLPGLVDLHAHPAPSNWKYGIDPDVEILPRGTTTILSQGDCGADDWPFYRETIIYGMKTRVRLAMSVARGGERVPGTAAFGNVDDLDVDAGVAAVEDGGELIWGLSVNASVNSCGDSEPRMVAQRTLDIAERTGRPILFGNRWDPYDWPISEQLDLLRSGDVLTYCFHAGPNGIVEEGKVIDAAWRARERGVFFDVGHGMSSFDFPTVEAAIADGFLPDTISTDQYVRHVGSKPQHDLPRTISKVLAAGMDESEAFARATLRPAGVLGMAGEVGTLRAGACADLAVLKWNEDALPLADVNGATRAGGCYEPVATVRAGEVI
ncbi:MAG: amidohydrolase family protein [Chloroflexota bacterium]|nr:amidohydrolase family protein [Chloroflexota bacterium]